MNGVIQVGETISALGRRTAAEPVSVGSFDAWPELHGAWYDDPFSEADLRWWDGRQWTEHVKPAEDPAPGSVYQREPARFSTTLIAALARLF